MPNDGSGVFWDPASPADNDIVIDGAKQIRDLRIGTATRVGKEHETFANGNGGGEHKLGSARAFFQHAPAPTKRPDGSATLSNADGGRLWIDKQTGAMYYFDESLWQPVKVSGDVKLSANQVGTIALIDRAVTNAKLAFNAVTADRIAENAVTEGKILNRSISGDKVKLRAITQEHLAQGIQGAIAYGLFTEAYPAGNGPPQPAASTWFPRRLNTIRANRYGIFANFSNFTVTCTPGWWRCRGGAVGHACGRFMTQVVNTNTGSTLAIGTALTAPAGASCWSSFEGEFYLAQNTPIQVWQILQTNGATASGTPSSFGTEEFAFLALEKLP